MTCNQCSITATSSVFKQFKKGQATILLMRDSCLSLIPISIFPFFFLIWTPTHLTGLMNSWPFMSTYCGLRKEGRCHEGQRRWMTGRKRWMESLVGGDVEGHGNMMLVLSKCWWLQTYKVSCELLWVHSVASEHGPPLGFLMLNILLASPVHNGLELLEWAASSCSDRQWLVGLSPAFAQQMLSEGQYICLIVLSFR